MANKTRRTFKSLSLKSQEAAAFYILMAPALIMFVLAKLWPFIWGVEKSFTNYNGFNINSLKYVGLANYERVFGDTEAMSALWRTLGIGLIVVPITLIACNAMALLLTINRRTHKAYIRTRDFNFSLQGLAGFDLHGKTVGIIGTGKIARELIRILKGFGMKVLAYDIFPDAEYAAQAQVEFVVGRIETALAVERRVDRLGHRTPPCRAHPGRLAQHLARRERQRHFGGGDQRLPVAGDRKAQPFACREHEGQTTVGTLHFIGFDRCGRSAEKRRRGQCQQKKSFHIESGLVVCRIRRRLRAPAQRCRPPRNRVSARTRVFPPPDWPENGGRRRCRPASSR